MNLTNKIKQLRTNLDGLSQLVTSVGIDSNDLLLAKAHLGSLLGEIGTPNPYSDNKKTVEDIEPTADTHRGIKHLEENGNWNTDYNRIEKVDWIRQEIQSIKDEFSTLVEEVFRWYYDEKNNSTKRILEIHLDTYYKCLCEAKYELGFEFQRLREESTKDE